VSLEPSQSSTVAPDTEVLRRAALRASWARDRRVARRRLALRWFVWALWRYGLALLLVAAVAAAVGAWMLSISQPATGPAPHTSPTIPPNRQEP
jgi:anti-sigma-K factor RskA